MSADIIPFTPRKHAEPDERCKVLSFGLSRAEILARIDRIERDLADSDSDELDEPA